MTDTDRKHKEKEGYNMQPRSSGGHAVCPIFHCCVSAVPVVAYDYTLPPSSLKFLILHSVATFLISRPVKLQGEKKYMGQITAKLCISSTFAVSLCLSQNYCKALRHWRQQQILTGDTHSIKGTVQHPDVLRRASCCLPGRSDVSPRTSSWH